MNGFIRWWRSKIVRQLTPAIAAEIVVGFVEAGAIPMAPIDRIEVIHRAGCIAEQVPDLCDCGADIVVVYGKDSVVRDVK